MTSDEIEGKFPVRRRVKIFQEPVSENADSWFEKNKYATLKAMTVLSDDLRLNRYMAVQMLSEAWTGEFLESSGGADSLDQLMQIVWIQHWSSILGLLSEPDIKSIRTLSESGQRETVLKNFMSRTRETTPVKKNKDIARITCELANQGRIIGIFHGAFAPPNFIHLILAQYYHQFCDYLVVGLDSDDLVNARKGAGRARYPFQKKFDVLSSFPHVIDNVVEVPAAIYRDGRYVDEEIVKFYRSLCVNMVFFNGSEPHRDWRIRQITDAGAQPFDHPVFGDGDNNRVFSSSQLMELKAAGLLPLEDLDDK